MSDKPLQDSLPAMPVNPVLGPSQRMNLAFLVQDHISTDGEQLYGQYYQFFQDEFEAVLLASVMHRHHGNQSDSARFLGMGRGALRKKLKRHGLLHYGKVITRKKYVQ